MKKLTALTLLASLNFTSFSFATEKYGNLLKCDNIDLSTKSSHHGKTFLHFIKETVKPELDSFALNGYKITDGNALVEGLDKVDSKVKRQAIKSMRGSSTKEKIENMKILGDKLVGENSNLYDLPSLLASTGLVSDRYTLSTYIGLISCGGSTVKFAEDNYAYNIHYGTGDVDKDDRTGRSFGASRIYHATDSSYTHYLKTLEDYVTKSTDNVQYFIQTIMETLTSSNPKSYELVNDYGDAVLTDFFAIWTAEQTRNLMDGFVKPHWDAALFQVTMISAFHAGQDEIKLFYRDPFTDEVYFTNKTLSLAWPRKNHSTQTCDVDKDARRVKNASLTDYIGVHYRTYDHCGRSGINMSRKEWGLLGNYITKFMNNDAKGSKLIEEIKDLMKEVYGNSYRISNYDFIRELAKFLINNDAPMTIKNDEKIAATVTQLMEYVKANAQKITKEIEDEGKYKAMEL